MTYETLTFQLFSLAFANRTRSSVSLVFGCKIRLGRYDDSIRLDKSIIGTDLFNTYRSKTRSEIARNETSNSQHIVGQHRQVR